MSISTKGPRSSPSFLKYKQFTSVLRVEGHFRCQFGCRFVFPDGHLVIVLLQADCGFWVCAVVVGSAGHEIDLDGTKVDIIKPQVDRFRLPRRSRCDRTGWKAVVKIWVATLAICPSRCRVPSRSRFRRSLFIEEFDEDQGLQKRFPALAERDRRESGENCIFQHSVRTIGDRELLPESSRTGNSSSPSRAPAGVVPHTRSSMGNSSSPSRAPAAERSRSGSREPKL